MLVIFLMGSLNYGSGWRGLVLSDEMISSSSEALARCRKVYSSCHLKIHSNYKNSVPLTVGATFGNQGFRELRGEQCFEKREVHQGAKVS